MKHPEYIEKQIDEVVKEAYGLNRSSEWVTISFYHRPIIDFLERHAHPSIEFIDGIITQWFDKQIRFAIKCKGPCSCVIKNPYNFPNRDLYRITTYLYDIVTMLNLDIIKNVRDLFENISILIGPRFEMYVSKTRLEETYQFYNNFMRDGLHPVLASSLSNQPASIQEAVKTNQKQDIMILDENEKDQFHVISTMIHKLRSKYRGEFTFKRKGFCFRIIKPLNSNSIRTLYRVGGQYIGSDRFCAIIVKLGLFQEFQNTLQPLVLSIC